MFVGIGCREFHVFDDEMNLLSRDQHGGVAFSIGDWSFENSLVTVKGRTLLVWRFRFGQSSLMFSDQIDIDTEGVVDLATSKISYQCAVLYRDKARVRNRSRKFYEFQPGSEFKISDSELWRNPAPESINGKKGHQTRN